MGINTNVYSYYGVRTEWISEFSDDYNELYDRNIEQYGYNNIPADADVEVLMDGMSCKYMVFGIQLYDSGDARWGEMVNSNEVDISESALAKMREEYLKKFKRLFPKHYDAVANQRWRLINLVHFS